MNAEEMKRASRGMGVDMSPEAIARRIRIVSRLRALTRELGKAEKVAGATPEPLDCREKSTTGVG